MRVLRCHVLTFYGNRDTGSPLHAGPSVEETELNLNECNILMYKAELGRCFQGLCIPLVAICGRY